MPSNAEREIEVERNYAAFKEMLPELLKEHRGHFALMHNREVVEIMETIGDAVGLAYRLYPDGEFSVQEITDKVYRLPTVLECRS